jgi:Ser/Thr protein kinase RdoA (MazF antagonist)
MTGRSTHDVEIGSGLVVKRFRSWVRGEHQREWRALNLLAEFAPGLAPSPVSADLDADPPWVRMTRVPGAPLAGHAIEPRHLDAIAAALNRLHTCIPPAVLTDVPQQLWLEAGVRSRMLALVDRAQPNPDDEPPVRAALDAGLRWLHLTPEPAVPLTPVFGQSDGNLANLLWDGSQVRLVDFEDSGRSDRAFELASLVEHVAVWHDAGIDAEALLDRFDLTAAESEWLTFFRCAFAIFWLALVRKRRDSVRHLQAERLLEHIFHN